MSTYRGIRLVGLARAHLPTAAVLLALAGLALWGHRTGWKAPKFATLWGGAPPAQSEDWCAIHNVPASKCIACRPELLGGDARDWCREHGVPESRCTVCHPEILTSGVAGDWCKEHGVPESNCTICHPEIAVKSTPPGSPIGASVVAAKNEADASQESSASAATPSAGAAKPDAWRAKPGASATVNKPKGVKDPVTCQTHALRVQFASPEAVRKVGLQFGSVTERPMAQTITANGETTYDRTHLAHVASRVPGVAWRVDKEIGQPVTKGEVLAVLDSVEIGRAKGELLQALAQRDVRQQAFNRIEQLLPQKISTEASYREAQASLRESQIRVFNARQAMVNLGLNLPAELGKLDERELQFLGLPEEVRRSLDLETSTANLIPVVAPLDGVVIARDIVAGEVVEASKPLFTVADTRRMWIMIDVPQTQIGQIALGQPIRFRPQGRDEAVVGEVAWISTAVDEQTRTVKVRAEVDNSDGKLLAMMFGGGEISVRQAPTAVAVPNDAIQWEGCCHIVFVRLTDEIYQPRKVRLGVRDAYYSEVLAGLLPGEVVVTAGSHVLKSEILKSNLGAGCCAEK